MKYDDYITPDQFDYELFSKVKPLKRKKGTKAKKRGNKRIDYLDCISAFDIETTNIKSYKEAKKHDAIEIIADSEKSFAFMYVNQMHFRFTVDDIKYDFTVICRTWTEYEIFLMKLQYCMYKDNKSECCLVVWVHNLQFEFSFLKSIFEFNTEDVFAMDIRKVVKARTGNIEFRCSYIQSNMGLELLTKGLPHAKLSGEDFDYSKIRHSETPLSRDEYQYCINDVFGLCEAMEKRMNDFGDDLYTIPMTSTGYVRREAKEALKAFRHSGSFKEQLDDYSTYNMLRKAFRGGDTHSNRFHSCEIIENVVSVDRSSSYPDVIVNEEYPMTKFKLYAPSGDEEMINKLIANHIPFLTYAIFTNIEVKEGCTDPYIPRSQCDIIYNDVDDKTYYKDSRKKKYKKGEGFYNDNGRVLKAELVKICITDVDWQELIYDYNYESVRFEQVMTSKYGKLPNEFIELVIKYYKAKTELKTAKPGVIETEKEKEDRETLYNKSKNLLNSLFGMLVMRVCIQSYQFFTGNNEVMMVPPYDNDGNEMTEEELYNQEVEKQILFYRVGVYITAHARKWLRIGIRIAGDRHVYNDTDSVKAIGIKYSEFDEINEVLKNRSIESGAFATDPKGETHYMGVFEIDGVYDKFCTMGSKKYCYTHGDEFSITISGVPKKDGAKEMIAKAKKKGVEPIELFKPGFVFDNSGKLMPIYHDTFDYGDVDITDLYGNTITEHVASSICLVETKYKLGLTEEYFDLINDCETYLLYALTDIQ